MRRCAPLCLALAWFALKDSNGSSPRYGRIVGPGLRPLARDLETNFYSAACSVYLNASACGADRCQWSDGACRELRCTSRQRWKYTGNPRHRLQSNVTDFVWEHDTYCPDLPFATNTYRAGVALGAAPDPGHFDRDLSAAQRLYWATTAPDEPYTVDVDKMTDAEIASSCVTMEQCVFPPSLTVVRRAANGSLWQPLLGSYKGKTDGRWVLNGDDPRVSGNATQSNNNYQIIKLLPPMSGYKVWGRVSRTSQRFYPRGSTAATAKVMRIDFSLGSERLYTYLDLTCGAGRGFSRRNGFLGQNQVRRSGRDWLGHPSSL
jgi:hypothetical protein